MPRRNNRETYEPLDLTPPPPAPRSPGAIGRSAPPTGGRDDRIRERAAASKRQADAKVNKAIDWSVCLVPGCGEELRIFHHLEHADPAQRDHNFKLPLCLNHLFVAFRQAKSDADEDLPVCVEANALVKERRRAKIDALNEAEKKAHLARTDGHIYVVRLNGLIKVGWSRTVGDRLRAYGPDVEILCVFPGTRHDETNLHRQFTPARARGREWYEDGPILGDFVRAMVAKWGTPSIETYWTRPKQVVASKRIR